MTLNDFAELRQGNNRAARSSRDGSDLVSGAFGTPQSDGIPAVMATNVGDVNSRGRERSRNEESKTKRKTVKYLRYSSRNVNGISFGALRQFGGIKYTSSCECVIESGGAMLDRGSHFPSIDSTNWHQLLFKAGDDSLRTNTELRMCSMHELLQKTTRPLCHT